jgi:hypothetical protein
VKHEGGGASRRPARLVFLSSDLLRPLYGTGGSFFFIPILLLASTLLWSLLSSFLPLLCVSGPGGFSHRLAKRDGACMCVVLVRECVYELGLATWACLSYFVCPSTYRWEEWHFDYICLKGMTNSGALHRIEMPDDMWS